MKNCRNKLIFFTVVFLLYSALLYSEYQGKIAVIGTGYVGLSTGLGLAEIGNTVICADIDAQKIRKLNDGIISIYEPGMADLLAKKISLRQISFTCDVNLAIKEADIIFIAVGTPMNDDGSADLSYIESVASMIAENITNPKIIVMKSTVPIGTGKWFRLVLENKGIAPELFSMVSNPEFLKEGAALSDFLYPDRIVIGVESNDTTNVMRSVYKSFLNSDVPIVFTDITTAETIKYASNAFLATKISFINEMSNLCDKTGANIHDVGCAMGLDKRISPRFLTPGPGFGGSCFPKDCSALLYMAEQHGLEMHVVSAALRANEYQKEVPFKKLYNLLSDECKFAGKTIAVLGLSFKANTDDIRYSPAIRTIELLLTSGCKVTTYDPKAMENMKKLFPNITYCSSALNALNDVDACVILTEWDEFRELDLREVVKLMKSKIIVDTRCILDERELKRYGFDYDVIGGKHNT